MMKKIIAAAMAVLTMAAATVSASAVDVDSNEVGADANVSAGADTGSDVGADTDSSVSGSGSVIYFDTTGWKNVQKIGCHVWQRGGDNFFAFGSKAENCTKVSDTKFSYDMSKLESSTLVPGGIKDGTDYCLLFYANGGAPQTYDMTFGKECYGDTAKIITDNMVENPKDSDKSAYKCVWTVNSSKYGPHLAITSIGNIVGSVLCPNESGEEVIGDWLPTYYNSSFFDPLERLTEALKKFKVTDVNNVYSYIYEKKKDDSSVDLAAIQKLLTEAYKKAYGESKDIKIDPKPKKYVKKSTPGSSTVSTPGSNGSQNGSGSGSGGSGSSGGYSSGSGNASGSGPDGQEDTILFILGGVMLLSAAAVFMLRKREE